MSTKSNFMVTFEDDEGTARTFWLKAKRYADTRKEVLGIFRNKLDGNTFYAWRVTVTSKVDDLTQFIKSE